jgi:hypothetical protein
LATSRVTQPTLRVTTARKTDASISAPRAFCMPFVGQGAEIIVVFSLTH